jgi:hypothetical protein
MKKILVTLVLLSSIGFASEYYAKLNPINTYNIKSAVNGQIIYVNNEIESNFANNNIIVKIDSKIDNEDLKQSTIKLKNLKDILLIEQGKLESYKKVSSKSKFEKDNQKVKVLNIYSSVSDLETRIVTLKDKISKKILVEKNNYIYDIAVEVGDYVSPGVLLYSSMDLSAGKLELFIPISSANDIQTKTIYLDGVQTDLKISKLYNIADNIHISSYKCEIIVPSPKIFSQLVKIEFK